MELTGVVVKINSKKLQDALGYTGKSPRWAVAYKFIPEKVTTVVEDIKVQVGTDWSADAGRASSARASRRFHGVARDASQR